MAGEFDLKASVSEEGGRGHMRVCVLVPARMAKVAIWYCRHTETTGIHAMGHPCPAGFCRARALTREGLDVRTPVMSPPDCPCIRLITYRQLKPSGRTRVAHEKAQVDVVG